MKALFIFSDNSEISLSDNHQLTMGKIAHTIMWEMYSYFCGVPVVEERIAWLRKHYGKFEVCN
jgi:hypothetical protein